jgi:integrase
MRVVKRLKYINHYRDRHGRERYYFRRPGQPQIALPGEPGTPEFDAAYNAATASLRIRPIGKDRSAVGTVSAAIAAYYTHNTFLALGKSTQASRRAVLEHFRNDYGDLPLAKLTRENVAKLLGKRRPHAAHNWLKTLRGLMRFAVEIGLRKDDPTEGIERVKIQASEGHHTWTEEEVARFEACWPIGSRQRLAFALLLYTGQRRGDVIRLGPQHLQNGMLFVRQHKTSVELLIPVHPELARIIAASQCGNLIFLTNHRGGPFSENVFSDRFREWCDAAGLPARCVAHGLRKAMCRRLADEGRSTHEIAAISGHKTLAEVQRYTAKANQIRLAKAAMASIV